MNKPSKPVKPLWENFPTPTEPNGKNFLGEPLYSKLDFVAALEKYNADMKQYEKDMDTYEQIKLIKLIKNSTEKYCLKSLRVNRI